MAKKQPGDVMKALTITNSSPPDVKSSNPTGGVNRIMPVPTQPNSNLRSTPPPPPDLVASNSATLHQTPDIISRNYESPVLVDGGIFSPISSTRTNESPELVSLLSGQTYPRKSFMPSTLPVRHMQSDSASLKPQSSAIIVEPSPGRQSGSHLPKTPNDSLQNSSKVSASQKIVSPNNSAQESLVDLGLKARNGGDVIMTTGVQPSPVRSSYLAIRSPPHVVREVSLGNTLHNGSIPMISREPQPRAPVTSPVTHVVTVRPGSSSVIVRKPVPMQSPVSKPRVSPPRGYVVVAQPLSPPMIGPIQQMIGFSVPPVSESQSPTQPQFTKGISSEQTGSILQSQPHFVSEGLVPVPTTLASPPATGNSVPSVNTASQQSPPASSPVSAEAVIFNSIPKPSPIQQHLNPVRKEKPHKPVRVWFSTVNYPQTHRPVHFARPTPGNKQLDPRTYLLMQALTLTERPNSVFVYKSTWTVVQRAR